MGRVYLVGAGPGDPGLITLRGVECLQKAEVVLYDYLVNPRILEHAPVSAQRVCLGRHGRDRVWSQDEINQRLVADAQAGRVVVRLKGGDPAVFARLADETDALVAAKVPFEVVPGITTALAVGSHAGIPLTHRGLASAVALVTGHEQDEKPGESLDFAALAAFPGTLVFYMGVTSVSHWTQALIAGGKSPDTPAAIIRRCSWPDQRTIRCTLGEVAGQVTQQKIRPPVVVVVGHVAGIESAIDWFTLRPLHSVRVLVTRPRGQGDVLARHLEELGAEVLSQPAIEILPPEDWRDVDRAIERIGDYDWLVFSSSNGVQAFLGRLHSLGRDVRSLGNVKLAAIGPATAEALWACHLAVDVQPNEYRAEALADALVSKARGKRFLLARASRGRDVLAPHLRDAGATVDEVVVYRSIDAAQPDPEVAQSLAAGKIDWVTVTSSAIARSLVHLFGEDLRRSKLVSISPLTSETLAELGFTPSAEAAQYTAEGIVAALLAARA
ncbi:MAG TPA: uroporphyrinogen-III C-methyltransferase [Pirellulales bacterium]|nr:uroporphyrinogen-III C-methyltransferase [Pirellulales bacterium]